MTVNLSEFDLEDLFLHLNAAVYLVDRSRKIIYWNREAERITGYPAEEVIGNHCFDNILIHVDQYGNQLCKGMCPLAHSIREGNSRNADVYLHHKQGHRVPVTIQVTPLRDRTGQVAGAMELFTEVSDKEELKKRVRELETIAMIDDLTRLPNRKFMEKELRSCFNEMKRDGLIFGVIFLDIDDFKAFNDEYGHLNGDRLLITVAATLEAVSRPYDIFGRWGGEEFVGVIRNVDRQALGRICNRYRALLENSTIRIRERFIGTTVSIGATIARPDDGLDSILNRADQLMYTSKKNGKNRVTLD